MANSNLLMSGTSKDQEFRESDYHTPIRKRAIIERKSSACVCLVISLIVIGVILFCITIGLRLTASHNKENYRVTQGDTQLIAVDSYYCQAVELMVANSDAIVKMNLLNDKPSLSGRSSINLNANFRINEFLQYKYEFGWYDYYEEDYDTIVDYVTWSYQLYAGSDVQLHTCISSTGKGEFYFIEGKAQYQEWTTSYSSYTYKYNIPSCESHTLTYFHAVSRDNRYYLVFRALSDQPFVNISLHLNRTEYVANDGTSTTCNNYTNSVCSFPLSLRMSPYYVLLQTIVTESSNYGNRVDLNWECDSRDWLYVVIFLIPLIFAFLLFTAMYCIFAFLNKRKLTSYNTLPDTNKKVNLVYEHLPIPI